ncbi:hypothetical protein NQ318_001413 [Aromia moschata]|uniref:Uncharacterized protein n=1 Tax=Aromia moschata TaxID=1265417 RepID=A0AAV8YXT8_9CUCU|nr:hypothetical protein NQ318_001413 [Aromia moschata]
MSLSDTQRIEILILLGCGDKTRTQKQSTVSRIENKFREFGNVTDIPKSGRKRILDDEQKLDILLDIQDNPHKPTRQALGKSGVRLPKLQDCKEHLSRSPSVSLTDFTIIDTHTCKERLHLPNDLSFKNFRPFNNVLQGVKKRGCWDTKKDLKEMNYSEWVGMGSGLLRNSF